MKFNNEAGRNQRLVASSYAGIARRQAILEALSIESDHKVIDIGCGAGYLVEELAKALGDHGRVYALDPSEDQLKEARVRCSSFSNVTFFRGFADNILLENDSCDIVTSTQAYEYVKDVDKALAESTRVLKPGGRIRECVNPLGLLQILWSRRKA
ncbi:methyltransferase domain-containing protein [Gammaproteobacteria bacterium]|nr:methyltransferase domain-containing protein [Gammaproteobacteria bacterium]